MRSAVISIKSNMYVSATEAIGCGPCARCCATCTEHHGAIIVSFTIGVGGAIMAEASLSYLGLGVPLMYRPGKYDQSGRTEVFSTDAATGIVARFCAFDRGLRHQYVRRRFARFARPAFEGGVGRYSMKGSTLEKLKARVDKYDRDH